MPAVATLTLANGESTPVNHYFAPLERDPKSGFFVFEDKTPRIANGGPLSWPRLGFRIRRFNPAGPGDSSAQRINRVELFGNFPQMETLGNTDNGLLAPATVAYIDRFKLEFLMPVRDSTADRADLRAYVKNVMTDTLMTSILDNLGSVW